MIKHLKFFSAIMLSIFLLASCGSKTTNNKEVENTSEEKETITSTAKVQSINLEESNVHWKGEMLGMYSHEGNIDLSKAELLMADGKIAGGSFEVDMTTMVPTDDNFNPAEGKTADKLVGHLSSPDFFDVENHATASFKINSVDGSTATGTLTVRGKSGEETVENITVNEDGSVTGELKFNRKNYDVAFDHPMKEMVLSNTINLKITLVTN